MILDRRTFLKAMGLAVAGIPAAINAAPRPSEAILPRIIHAQGTSLKFDGVEVFSQAAGAGLSLLHRPSQSTAGALVPLSQIVNCKS